MGLLALVGIGRQSRVTAYFSLFNYQGASLQS